MRHPTTSELLDLHFGEQPAGRARRLREHVEACAACRRLLEDVGSIEQLLAAVEASPPLDGLPRLLAQVTKARPAAASRPIWLGAALPSATAVLTGALAIAFAGRAGAAAFFAAGTLVTLSLAPALILEAQGRRRPTAAR